jgi:glycosyltransferase involved in cell wall biosynthesis
VVRRRHAGGPRLLDRSINGAAAARNAGFDRATGDIVICYDDVVVAEPTTIERLLIHY